MATPSAFSPAFSPTPHPSHYAPSPAPSHHHQHQPNTPRPNPPLPRRAQAQAQAHAAPPSARSTVGTQGPSGVVLEDVRVELRRTVGLLVGVEGGQGEGEGGELRGVGEGVEEGRRAWEGAYEEEAPPPLSPASLLARLAHLQTLLRSSPIGAVALSPSPNAGAAAGEPEGQGEAGAANLAVLGREQGATVQALFRQRQRAKEGAEVAASVLGAA